MMLDHLWESQAAKDIDEAITQVVASGEVKILELGGAHKTHEVGGALKKATAY